LNRTKELVIVHFPADGDILQVALSANAPVAQQ
jgi:hypothetical protein